MSGICNLRSEWQPCKYSNPEESLNKRSELVYKCDYLDKYLLCNYKTKD